MVDVNLMQALYKGYTVRSDGVVLNPKGKRVGWQRDDGYVFVFIKKERWRLHRLMWHTLVQPLEEDTVIDHADGNPANNNLSNLRACSRSENQYNRRAKKGNTAGGLKGVYRRDTKSGPRYVASYTNKGAVIYIGTYRTPEEAHAAYRSATAAMHGEFSDLNR